MENKKIKLSKIYFDPDNLRYDFDFNFTKVDNNRIKNKSHQLQAQKKLSKDIKGLIKSIVHNDFLYNERIITKKIDEDAYVVIEGNRRIASLKYIEDNYDVADLLPTTASIITKGIDVLVVNEDGFDEDILMGMRHVTGIKPWGGFSKAKLIVKLKDKKAMDFEEISNRLGESTVPDVKKRYNAYKLLENMLDEGYVGEDVTNYFTLFFEAIGKPAYRQFLGYNSDTISFENTENLDRFYNWIIPQEGEDGLIKPAIITNPHDLRQVALILKDDDALTILEDSGDVLSAIRSSELVKNKEIKKHIRKIKRAVEEITIGDLGYIDDEDLENLESSNKLLEKLLKYKSS
ncbi:hypothetical protein I5168_04695 [Nonlabens sp. SCSIO 43208]|uniref:ParB N-terminal domain-containing protein n=1 Tax=Nonlabens sp. SCSIO 43208 TaxID=2793009 RepID=UPI003D6BE438